MGGVTRRTVLAASAAWPIMAPALAGATDRFRDQLQAFGEDLIRLSPEYALSAGAPAGFADRLLLRTLDDYSSAGEARLRAIVREKERALRNAHAPGPDGGAFALQVARAMAANASRSAGFSYGWLKPLMGMHLPYAVSHRSGPSASSADLMADLQPVSDPGDAEAYLEKLGAFGPAFTGAAEKLRADASLGCVVPAVLLEKAVAGMEAFTQNEPEGSPLVMEFVRKCERAGMPAAQVDRLRAVATARVRSIVYPAYAGLRSAALEQARAGKEAHGVWSLPQGDAFYAAVVATQGDTTLAPAEIHAFGLEEVARLRGELDTRLRKLGAPSGSLRDRLAAARAGKGRPYPGGDAGRAELLRDLEGVVRRAEAVQPRILHRRSIPTASLEIKRTPVHRESVSGGAYYLPSSGGEPGAFYVNLADPTSHDRAALVTLAVHEGVPGHHTQASVALTANHPLFVRLGWFVAYGEGWALYAERLMSELGFYDEDPLCDVGRLTSELFRAARLVVDTGLHQQRWSRDRGAAYLRTETALAEGRIGSEVDRYLATPGQALGYHLGQTRLLQLRESARTRLAEHFDVRDFHEVVLRNGPAPLSVVEAAVNRWVKAAKV